MKRHFELSNQTDEDRRRLGLGLPIEQRRFPTAIHFAVECAYVAAIFACLAWIGCMILN